MNERIKSRSGNICYTTGIRTKWVGENPSPGTTHRVTDPVLGTQRINVYTAMLSITVTLDMVEDAAFPLVSWLSGKFNETIELLRDNTILNGTGIGQPFGILANPGGTDQPAVVNSGDANLLKPDGIINTAFALPEQYDNNGAWVFNKTSTALAISELKDTTNRYLWGMGVQDSGIAGDFRTRPLLGYPVVYSGFMPNVAASAYVAVFGDLTGYYFLNRVGFSLQVLRERYAEENQLLILGRVRFGGHVAEPWKLKVHRVHS